jgi:drug/metabolite transporter (DMT)-like permease
MLASGSTFFEQQAKVPPMQALARNKAAAGAALLLTATTAWGGMFPIADRALHHIDPFWLTSIRYTGASLIFVALLVLAEGRAALSSSGQFGRVFVLGTAGFAGFNLLGYVGLEHTRPQSASLILALMPMVTLLVVWARTKIAPAPVQLGLVAVALAGVALVISKGHVSGLVQGGIGGDALMLAGATLFVLYTMGASSFVGWSPLRFTTMSAIGGTLSILVITFASTAFGWISAPTGNDLSATAPALVYVILLAAVVAVLSWNVGISLLGPQNGTLFLNVVPITTFAIAIIRGYHPVDAELFGVAIAIGALVAANVYARQATAIEATAATAPSAAPSTVGA